VPGAGKGRAYRQGIGDEKWAGRHVAVIAVVDAIAQLATRHQRAPIQSFVNSQVEVWIASAAVPRGFVVFSF